MLTRDVYRQLQNVISSERLIIGDKVPFRYRFDALRPYRSYPPLKMRGYAPTFLVRPESTEEVVGIVRIAKRFHVPIVPYGAGTGLMGAAIPVRRGLLIDTGLLRNVNVTRDDHYVYAQAGTILDGLFETVRKHDMFFAHDPWTRPIATLGGSISTNSLGYLGAKYGSIGNQLLALEAVLPNGDVVKTRPAQFSSTGLDLRRLFVATEGQFGIVTSATVRIFPKPEKFALASYHFRSFGNGFRAICTMRDKGIRPSMIDYGQTDPHENTEPQLNLAFDGLNEEVETHIVEADSVIRDLGGSRVDDDEAQQFWDHRHDVALTYREHITKTKYEREPRTKYDYIHVSLPSSKILEFNGAVLKTTKSAGIRLLEVGLWHGPELYSIVLSSTDAKPRFAAKKLWKTSNRILEIAQGLGGCMEFCHGVGLKLAHLMQQEHGLGLALMQRLKHAVDPLGIMNPGKEAL